MNEFPVAQRRAAGADKPLGYTGIISIVRTDSTYVVSVGDSRGGVVMGYWAGAVPLVVGQRVTMTKRAEGGIWNIDAIALDDGTGTGVTGSVAHADTTGQTGDDHHAEVHTIVSHDTTATGANLTTLTDGSNADALHAHAASGGAHTIQEDGTPLTDRANLNFVSGLIATDAGAGPDATDVDIDPTLDLGVEGTTPGSLSVYGDATVSPFIDLYGADDEDTESNFWRITPDSDTVSGTVDSSDLVFQNSAGQNFIALVEDTAGTLRSVVLDAGPGGVAAVMLGFGAINTGFYTVSGDVVFSRGGTAVFGGHLGGGNEYLAIHLNGSATDPSFTRSTDDNTGIFWPAADSMAFAAGGVEIFRIIEDVQDSFQLAAGIEFEVGATPGPGTSGFILESQGAALSPEWVDPSTVSAGVSNPLQVGTDDDDPGLIQVFGGAAAESGGEVRIYLAADDDTNADYFSLLAAGTATNPYLSISTSEAEFMRWRRVTTNTYQLLLDNDGSISFPSIAPYDDLNTGIVFAATGDQLQFAAGGVNMLQLTEGTNDQVLVGPAGSEAAPVLARVTDADTGLEWSTADTLGLVAGARTILRIVESTTDYIELDAGAEFQVGATPGPGSSGDVLTSQGPALSPEWAAPAAAGGDPKQFLYGI